MEDGVHELKEGQVIGRVTEFRDKGIIAIQCSLDGLVVLTGLSYLPPRFRGVLFLKRGSFVILSSIEGTEVGQDKVTFSIENVLRVADIKSMRKDGAWYVVKVLLPC